MSVKIKYVGAKLDGERAFKEKTGIEWFQGDVHAVSAEHAAEMLRHPDVFEAADADASLSAAKKPEAVAAKTTEGGGNSDPLAGMDDKAVRAFAKEKDLGIAGLNFKKGDALREVVLKALAEKK